MHHEHACHSLLQMHAVCSTHDPILWCHCASLCAPAGLQHASQNPPPPKVCLALVLVGQLWSNMHAPVLPAHFAAQ
jgi:hypothetical protein